VPYINGKRVSRAEWQATRKLYPFTVTGLSGATEDKPEDLLKSQTPTKRTPRRRSEQVATAVAAATGITPTIEELSTEAEETNV
jgi:hypothetical protein